MCFQAMSCNLDVIDKVKSGFAFIYLSHFHINLDTEASFSFGGGGKFLGNAGTSACF